MLVGVSKKVGINGENTQMIPPCGISSRYQIHSSPLGNFSCVANGRCQSSLVITCLQALREASKCEQKDCEQNCNVNKK